MRDDEVYLRHIVESISLVQRYMTGSGGTLDESLFYDDSRTQDAVLRRMETLADAASHLSDALKSRHPHIPWRQINDFRNVLAHGYTEIRLDRVWQVIVDDLSAFHTAVARELNERSDSAEASPPG